MPKRIPDYNEAKDELGEGAMDFLMSMIRQEYKAEEETPEEDATEKSEE